MSLGGWRVGKKGCEEPFPARVAAGAFLIWIEGVALKYRTLRLQSTS